MMDDRDDSEESEARNAKPYDGILGSLPDWVPGPIQRDFVRYRNYVLETWLYKPAKAVEILDQFLNSNWTLDYSEKHPDGKEIDVTLFSMIFGFLHKVRWALGFPLEDALYLLSGKYAVSGYRMAKNLGKGRPATTLQILTNRTISELSKFGEKAPSADDVLNALQTYDNARSPILEVIDRELNKIFYNDNKGIEKHVSLRRFANIVSEELNRNK